MIRTRFAPSPTGYLHLGNLRTALFSWLFARHRNGKFILRIEDTDRVRENSDSVQKILEVLTWLGINWDEGPYFQSKRIELYNSTIKTMLEKGQAYRCICSQDRLEKLRQEQIKNGLKPRYDRKCLNSSENLVNRKSVIRFANPQDGEVVFSDRIYGDIKTKNQELDDFIIQRNDGIPTYNFTVVVDDIEMAITHVIRGANHITNTARQINLYRSLDAKPPTFVHLPLILGSDGKVMAKRHGAPDALAFRERGILPNALLNYLARLGWAHGNQELFNIPELTSLFSLSKIHRSPARFDEEKLLWFNRCYLKRLHSEDLVESFRIEAVKRGLDPNLCNDLNCLIKNQLPRVNTLIEIIEQSQIFLKRKIGIIDSNNCNLRTEDREILKQAATKLFSIPEEDWVKENISENLKQICNENNLPFQVIAKLMRLALTGSEKSLPIDVTLYLLGKVLSLERLEQVLIRESD